MHHGGNDLTGRRVGLVHGPHGGPAQSLQLARIGIDLPMAAGFDAVDQGMARVEHHHRGASGRRVRHGDTRVLVRTGTQGHDAKN